MKDEALAGIAGELELVYRKRGAHRETLTALSVVIALHGDDAEARARFDEVVRWLRGEAHLDGCSGGSCNHLIEDLEAAIGSWPTPFLVDKLALLYRQRQAGGGSPRSLDGSGGLAQLYRSRTALSVARTGADLSRSSTCACRARTMRCSRSSSSAASPATIRRCARRAIGPTSPPTGAAIDRITVADAFARDGGGSSVSASARDRAVASRTRSSPRCASVDMRAQTRSASWSPSRPSSARGDRRPASARPGRRWRSSTGARLQQLVAEERTDEFEA